MRQRYMDAPPTVEELHSARMGDDGTYVSLWLVLSDGSLAAANVPLDALLRASYVIERADEAPHLMH